MLETPFVFSGEIHLPPSVLAPWSEVFGAIISPPLVEGEYKRTVDVVRVLRAGGGFHTVLSRISPYSAEDLENLVRGAGGKKVLAAVAASSLRALLGLVEVAHDSGAEGIVMDLKLAAGLHGVRSDRELVEMAAEIKSVVNTPLWVKLSEEQACRGDLTSSLESYEIDLILASRRRIVEINGDMFYLISSTDKMGRNCGFPTIPGIFRNVIIDDWELIFKKLGRIVERRSVRSFSLKRESWPEVVQELCDKCGGEYNCIRACPVNAIKKGETHPIIIPELCVKCGLCIELCPRDAIKQVFILKVE